MWNPVLTNEKAWFLAHVVTISCFRSKNPVYKKKETSNVTSIALAAGGYAKNFSDISFLYKSFRCLSLLSKCFCISYLSDLVMLKTFVIEVYIFQLSHILSGHLI